MAAAGAPGDGRGSTDDTLGSSLYNVLEEKVERGGISQEERDRILAVAAAGVVDGDDDHDGGGHRHRADPSQHVIRAPHVDSAGVPAAARAPEKQQNHHHQQPPLQQQQQRQPQHAASVAPPPAFHRAPRAVTTRNVPERLLFAVDLSTVHSAVLGVVRTSLKILARTKSMMGSGHTFGLAALSQDLVWLLDFTPSVEELSSMLDSLTPQVGLDALDLGHCVGAVAEKMDMGALARGEYVVRLILVHSRNDIAPVQPHSAAANFLENPAFFVDMLHIAPPGRRGNGANTNTGPDMRANLGRLLPDPYFYAHSVSSDARQLQPAIAALSSHALLRPGRQDAHYALEPRAVRQQ